MPKSLNDFMEQVVEFEWNANLGSRTSVPNAKQIIDLSALKGSKQAVLRLVDKAGLGYSRSSEPIPDNVAEFRKPPRSTPGQGNEE